MAVPPLGFSTPSQTTTAPPSGDRRSQTPAVSPSQTSPPLPRGSGPRTSYPTPTVVIRQGSPAQQDSPSSSEGAAVTPAASRKQFASCDACRHRKIRCVRTSEHEKCASCTSKNLRCTFNYVTKAAADLRASRLSKRARTEDGDRRQSTPHPNSGSSITPTDSAATSRTAFSFETCRRSSIIPPLSPEPERTSNTSLDGALTFLFSPHNDDDEFSTSTQKQLAANAELRHELAVDLLQTFETCVLIRLPLIDMADFRSDFERPDPISQTRLAIVLAWGAKFSKHDIILEDRHEVETRTGRPRSQIAARLERCAEELFEEAKAHRIATLENAQDALLLDILRAKARNDFSYPSPLYWTQISVRHMLELGYNFTERLETIADPTEKVFAGLTWWIALLTDANSCAFLRRKPVLSRYDCENEPPFIPQVGFPAEKAAQLHAHFKAFYGVGLCSLRFAEVLWSPSSQKRGIPAAGLSSMLDELQLWAAEWLHVCGLTASLGADEDYRIAANRCVVDLTYHSLLAVLADAVRDFGIKDNAGRKYTDSSFPSELQLLYDRAESLAMAGARHVAAAVPNLIDNGYLKIDPHVLRFPIYGVGSFLARRGRAEALICAIGLREYTLTYDGAEDDAAGIEAILAAHREVSKLSLGGLMSTAPIHDPYIQGWQPPLEARQPPPSFDPIHLSRPHPILDHLSTPQDIPDGTFPPELHHHHAYTLRPPPPQHM